MSLHVCNTILVGLPFSIPLSKYLFLRKRYSGSYLSQSRTTTHFPPSHLTSLVVSSILRSLFRYSTHSHPTQPPRPTWPHTPCVPCILLQNPHSDLSFKLGCHIFWVRRSYPNDLWPFGTILLITEGRCYRCRIGSFWHSQNTVYRFSLISISPSIPTICQLQFYSSNRTQ